jgi:hypothetical protein
LRWLCILLVEQVYIQNKDDKKGWKRLIIFSINLSKLPFHGDHTLRTTSIVLIETLVYSAVIKILTENEPELFQGMLDDRAE